MMIAEEHEVTSILLHIAQNVEGNVRNTVASDDKNNIKLYLTPVGVDIVGPKTLKTIPFSNIQNITYGHQNG